MVNTQVAGANQEGVGCWIDGVHSCTGHCDQTAGVRLSLALPPYPNLVPCCAVLCHAVLLLPQGPAPALQSYLSIEAVVRAAKKTGARAVRGRGGGSSRGYIVACMKGKLAYIGDKL
jgi:hypothetical protein